MNPDFPNPIFIPVDHISPSCMLEVNEFFLNKSLQDVLYYAIVWSSGFLDILQAYSPQTTVAKISFNILCFV